MADGTTSMWLQMLGLGPVMEQITNPDFQKQLQAFAQAQFDTHARCIRLEARAERIETNLLLLMVHMGMAADGSVQPGRNLAAVPAGNRTDGHRVATPTGGAFDNGSGRIAGAIGGPRNGSGQGGG